MKKRKKCIGKHKVKPVLDKIMRKFKRETSKLNPIGYGTEMFPKKISFKDYYLDDL